MAQSIFAPKQFGYTGFNPEQNPSQGAVPPRGVNTALNANQPFVFTPGSSTNPGFNPLHFNQYTGSNPLDQFSENVKPTDFNAWGELQKQNQRTGEADLLGQQSALSQGAQATAQSGLAMRGGISGGAAQRLGTSAVRQQMLGAQNVRLEGQQARLGIGADAEGKQAAENARVQGIWSNLANQQAGQQQDLFNYQQGLNLMGQHDAQEATAAQNVALAQYKASHGGMTAEEVSFQKKIAAAAAAKKAAADQAILDESKKQFNRFTGLPG